MRQPHNRQLLSQRVLALAAGLICGVTGCVAPPAEAWDNCPRVVRFPWLEEHSHLGAPGHAAVVYDEGLGPPVLPAEVCPAAGPGHCLAGGERQSYGDPAEVESAAFTQFGRPPRFLPVPTVPVFGPR